MSWIVLISFAVLFIWIANMDTKIKELEAREDYEENKIVFFED